MTTTSTTTHDEGAARPGDLERLVAHLRARDVPCPLCGYNLRDLTEDTCPECRLSLRLSVGPGAVHFGWFLVAVAPGIFAGLAAVLLLSICVTALAVGESLPPVVVVLLLLGAVSGGVAAALISRRHRFIQLSVAAQRGWALLIWGAHALPFLGLLLLIVLTS